MTTYKLANEQVESTKRATLDYSFGPSYSAIAVLTFLRSNEDVKLSRLSLRMRACEDVDHPIKAPS